MFALLICLAAGIRPIITSSSDKKLDIARSLGQQGAVDVINYATHPKWDEEALRLTNGRGVDIVLENVGPTTVAQSLASLARRGTVSLIGFLGGLNPEHFPDTLGPLLVKTATMKFVPNPVP
jgi:NADPH:quinone reductase-like Zn-dependent oxidoreductase